MKAKYTDDEFVRLWHDAKSRGIGTRTLAAELGVDTRNMMRRRRRVEQSYGSLPALGTHPTVNIAYDTETLHLDHEYTVVIFSDCHWWPNVESPATWVLLEVVQDIQPDIIIANGDIVDGWQISRHPRIGYDVGPTVAEEIEVCKAWMGLIQGASEADLYWTVGNHDIRFETFLATHAGQYDGVDGFSLEHHFPEWKQCWSVNLSDDVIVKHRYKGGVNAARANALNAGLSMVTGHTHKLRVVPVTDYRGTRYGVEGGTLLDPQGPQMLYAEHNPLDMQQGFIVLEMTADGPRFEPVEVIEGRARWRGKIYKS